MILIIKMIYDILRLIMLESSIDHNVLFFMSCQYCYKLSKDLNYWKTLFNTHQIIILSQQFHKKYPDCTYQWVKEYRLSEYALRKTKALWIPMNNDHSYQCDIIGYINIDDDLSWLPDLFYYRIHSLEFHKRERHELHFLLNRTEGLINYHAYDNDDELIGMLTYYANDSKFLVTSMLYHLPHIRVEIL